MGRIGINDVGTIEVRRVLIKDVIIDLRKALIKKESIFSDVETVIDRLYQILNKKVS